jgi:aldehyde dehydrogenase (NAD+)
VLDDADLQQAIPQILAAGFGNNGQACINGTRVLLPKSRLAEFSAAITEAVANMQVGDPWDSKTTLGPLVSRKQFERVERYIKLGIEEGAEVLLGGEGSPEGLEDGFFVKPTVFGGVTNDMTIAREEIFGPVIALLTYETEEDAIRIANDTTYGLHAYVLSANFKRARAVAARLQAGRVSINGGQHEPLAPFGGFKQSGIGREFGVYGLEAYLEPKAVLGSFTE